jgi:hypothetical protein
METTQVLSYGLSAFKVFRYTLIDYAVVSPLLFKCISYFNIANFDPISSDIHCPVVINFDTSVTLEPDNTLSNDVIYKSKWNKIIMQMHLLKI